MDTWGDFTRRCTRGSDKPDTWKLDSNCDTTLISKMEIVEKIRMSIFLIHAEEQLVEWTRQLNYFRYVRNSWSADSLMAIWQYKDLDDLEQYFSNLGVKIRVFNEKPDQPIAGVPYPQKEIESFASLIPGTKWWEQPGNVVIKDEPVYIDCYNGMVAISIFHGRGEVFAEQFESAIRLEAKLPPLKLRNVMPPVDEKYCFSQTTHPKCFPETGLLTSLISKIHKK